MTETTLIDGKAFAARLRTELGKREYRPKTPAQIEHVVAQGDSLWLIARHYNVSVAQLLEWNGLDARAHLRLGARLRVLPAG